ncbi:MAG: hypothetical protein ACTMHH_03810 [Nesterenkonia sp.]
MTDLISPALPWHQSLEQWCAEHIGHSRQAVQTQAQFAPFEAHKPEKFHQVAVVLMVLTSATHHVHRGFAEAAELIRASTSGFRAVLVTDLYRPPALEVCDWPVEQLLAEETWSAHQSGNWLTQAAEHLRAAQQTYGASYIIAPTGAGSAAAALRHLGYVYNAPTAVLAQALEIFTAAAGDSAAAGESVAADDDAAAPLGFRHGWETIAAGNAQRRRFVSAEAEQVEAHLHRGTGRGLVLDPEGQMPDEFLRAAQDAGWSTAVFPAAPQGSNTPGRFAANVQRACADALHAGGPVLVCSPAGEPVETSAEGRIVPAGPDGQWSIELDSVAVVRFAPDQAPEVLSRLQSVSSTLLLR